MLLEWMGCAALDALWMLNGRLDTEWSLGGARGCGQGAEEEVALCALLCLSDCVCALVSSCVCARVNAHRLE